MSRKMNFTQEERECFYNAIVDLDDEGVFVLIDKEADTLSYTDKITSGERISGRPSDEELTRCLILLNLINRYRYEPSQIEIENRFNIGGRREEGARAVETDIIIKNNTGR